MLERKIVALDDERVIRAVELQEMAERLSEAQDKRDTLAAAAGSRNSDETTRAADDLFDELDRMAGEMTGPGPGSRQSHAMDDIDQELRDLHVDQWAQGQESKMDPDPTLEELPVTRLIGEAPEEEQPRALPRQK